MADSPEDDGMKTLMEAVAQVSRKRKSVGMATAEVRPATITNETMTLHDDNDMSSKAQRLEHNRLAAKETRRRKKRMVEGLQRSVDFYNQANATLKSQNHDLEYQLLAAKQAVIAKQGKGAPGDVSLSGLPNAKPPTARRAGHARIKSLGNASKVGGTEAQRAHQAATQALYKRLGSRAGMHLKPSTIDCLSTRLWRDPSAGQSDKTPGNLAADTVKSAAVNTVSADPRPSPHSSPPLPVAGEKRSAKVKLDNTACLSAMDRFDFEQAAATFGTAKSASAVLPHPLLPYPPPFAIGSHERPPTIASDNTAYLLALDRLVLKQAAATNAARAAAAAAARAVQLRRKLYEESRYRPYSHPSSALWPLQNT